MADRFYTNCELAPGLVVLRGPEAHHLGTVCRARPGDAVCLFNGDGREYPGRIVEVTRRDVVVEVQGAEAPPRELPFALHVAAPLPKGDRAQFLVEKLTEVGATRLTLLSTRRSVIQPREARIDRLERYVVEASKQCGRNVLMAIDGPRDLAAVLADTALQPSRRYFAHPGAAGVGGGEEEDKGGDVVVAVGPEGGFADDEVAAALAAGWRAIDLGPRILRVETAAVVLAARWGARPPHPPGPPLPRGERGEPEGHSTT